MMQGFVKEKEFYKQAACIAIPISLQSVITIGVSMMDNIMVGALGETALSAVALANQFIGIYQIGCMGIGMGASVLTARFWGMKDITSLKKVVTIMFRICIGLALLVFMAPTLLIPDRLMRIYTEEAEVIAQGILYYRWMVPCYLLHGLTLTSTLILRSAGQVQIPLVSSAGAFFVNIFFNYIFIFGELGAPKMGVQGAALGTLLARIFEFVFICGYFFGKDQKIGYRIKDLFGECASLLGEYIRVALPVVISDTLLALGNTVSGDGHGTNRKWICICKFNYGGDSADQYGSDSVNLSCRVHYHRAYTWTRRAGKSAGAGMDLSVARSDCGGSRSRDYFADPFLCNRAL